MFEQTGMNLIQTEINRVSRVQAQQTETLTRQLLMRASEEIKEIAPQLTEMAQARYYEQIRETQQELEKMGWAFQLLHEHSYKPLNASSDSISVSAIASYKLKITRNEKEILTIG